MLPSDYNDGLVNDFTVITQPTLTYRLNFDGQPSYGKLNGIEAVKQAIWLILHTERFEYTIFSWNYGIELKNLLGEQKTPFVQAKIKKAIEDALLTDDRILEVNSFEFKQTNKALTVSFKVNTTQGEILSEYTFEGGAIS